MAQSFLSIRFLMASALLALIVQPQEAHGQVMAGFSAIWSVYRGVMRGSRLIRDLTEGAGTVTKAISTFDNFLESDPGMLAESVADPVPTAHEPSDNAYQHQAESDDEVASSAFESFSMEKNPSKVVLNSQSKRRSIGKSDDIDLLAIAEGEDLLLSQTTEPLEFSPLDAFRSSREGAHAERRHRRSRKLRNPQIQTVALAEGREISELSGCEVFLSHVKDKKLPVNKMSSCCAQHAACYSSGCRTNTRRCDRKLKSCLLTSCRRGNLRRSAKKSCKATTKLIHRGTVANSLLEHSDGPELLKCKWKGDRNRRGR